MDSGSDADDGTDVRVFLVDDHKVVRSGLAAYLATEPGMRVVGEAGDGRPRSTSWPCSRRPGTCRTSS